MLLIAENPKKEKNEMKSVRDIIHMKVDDIIPYDNNPREIADAVGPTADSIKEFGFDQPIAVDQHNVIICGHTRLLAAKLLGMEEVPVVVVDWLTPEQVKAYRIADNKTGEKSTWNITRLVQELKDLEEANYNECQTGFDMSEIELMMAETDPVADGETDPDELPEVAEEPRSIEKAVYALGDHRLMCGDSTDMSDLRKLVGMEHDEVIDLWLTDPPYNVAYVGKGNGESLKNDSLSDAEFQDFLSKAFINAASVMHCGAAFYIFYGEIQVVAFRQAIEKANLKFSQNLIWIKNNHTLSRLDYQYIHEPCMYGWKKGEKHIWNSDRKQRTLISIPNQPFSQRSDGKWCLKVGNKVYTLKEDAVCEEEKTSILAFDQLQKCKKHPTMKSTEMLVYLIKNSSNREAKVLDNFCGSGSTLIACEQTNRICYGMELDRHYCDVIRKRWAEFKFGKDCDWLSLTPQID